MSQLIILACAWIVWIVEGGEWVPQDSIWDDLADCKAVVSLLLNPKLSTSPPSGIVRCFPDTIDPRKMKWPQ